MKCLYRHLFLEDISKLARVIKKDCPFWNSDNSLAPEVTDLKVCLWLAKRLTWDITSRNNFYHEAVLSYSDWKEMRSQILRFQNGQSFFLMTLACLDVF